MSQVELPAKLMQIKDKLYTQNEYGASYPRTETRLSEPDKDFLRENFEIDKNKELHDMCINCQARQIIKYYGEKPAKGKINRFNVPCNGVKKHLKIDRESLDSLMADDEIDHDRAFAGFSP